jgi:lysophospholipase L1-like esterase
MKHFILTSTSIFCALAFAASALAQDVRVLGRSIPDASGGFAIQWPGSGFEARFQGTTITASIEDYGQNSFNVEVDRKISRLDLMPGTHMYTLFTGAGGDHTIRITRRTSANAGITRIGMVRSDGTLQPTAPPERRMLVIGDSVSSGYGVEGTDQSCTYSRATQNHDAAYAALTARAFGADLHSLAIDGAGLVRNDRGAKSSIASQIKNSLPDDPRPWPVAAFQPQVIVLYLGTNDFAGGDPGVDFATAYLKILGDLRGDYPKAQIFAAVGPMLGGSAYTAARDSIRAAVEERRALGDSKAEVIQFQPSRSARQFGCDWHPGLDAQKNMAETLQRAIARDLGWSR